MESSGVFRSPDIDNDGYYDNNLNCSWTIVTETDRLVLLLPQVEQFDVEASSSCRFYFGSSYFDSSYTGLLQCHIWMDTECRFDSVKLSRSFCINISKQRSKYIITKYKN